jgi:hypothetical protein
VVRIHINRHAIDANRKRGGNNPPISIVRAGRTTRAYGVQLLGNVRIVYRPHKPLRCGARLWVECDDAIICDSDEKSES